MNEVPNEILTGIIWWLRPRDLLTASHVCGLWREVAWDRKLWAWYCRRLAKGDLNEVGSRGDLNEVGSRGEKAGSAVVVVRKIVRDFERRRRSRLRFAVDRGMTVHDMTCYLVRYGIMSDWHGMFLNAREVRKLADHGIGERGGEIVIGNPGTFTLIFEDETDAGSDKNFGNRHIHRPGMLRSEIIDPYVGNSAVRDTQGRLSAMLFKGTKPKEFWYSWMPIPTLITPGSTVRVRNSHFGIKIVVHNPKK
jgi:F-box-like